MSRNIVITSGKGGVGKTTVCANIGYTLARNGLKVLMMDVDLGLNNLDVVMGVENKVVYDIIDVIDGKCRPKQALIQDFSVPNLYILPSNHSYYTHKIEIDKVKKIVHDVSDMFDYVLIDCPAGIDIGFVRAVELAHDAIVVTTPHISAVRDADKVFSLLNNYDINEKYLIINRARGDLMLSGDMIGVDTITDYVRVELLGVIPEDDNIAAQLLVGGAVDMESDASEAFQMLCNNLHCGVRKVFDCTKKYRGFVGSIRRNLRRKV